jgi:pimeloyl-ACP methyl ester carboxylesterase
MVLGLGALLSGCVSSILARKIVAPPNKSGIPPLFADSEVLKHAPEVYSESWAVQAGPPEARIVVASIEPGDYGLVHEVRFDYAEGKAPQISHFNAYWRSAAEVTPWSGPPRGTILLLHGYLQDKRSVTPWAVRLAQAGFRCLVVDLRGHGASTGEHISFGAFESRDLELVLDDLARRGWSVEHVGLLGVSYGASIGLVTAGRDRRIASVVAFAPFASAERAIPELMRAAFPDEARGISDKQFAMAHVKEAARGGFSWQDADIPAALKRTTAPVLFIHGEKDNWVSADHSRELMKVAPPGSKLMLAPLDNHISLPMQLDQYAGAVIGWFDKGLN